MDPVADRVAAAVVRGINRRLVHEVAQAWWSPGVVPAACEDHWLAESLAEHCAALAMTLRSRGDHDGALARWRDESDAGGSVSLANFLVGEDAWRDRRALLHAR